MPSVLRSERSGVSLHVPFTLVTREKVLAHHRLPATTLAELSQRLPFLLRERPRTSENPCGLYLSFGLWPAFFCAQLGAPPTLSTSSFSGKVESLL